MHHAPLLLPEMEALDVQLERFPTPGQRDALDHPLVLGNDPVAGVALLAVTGPTPHPRNAVVGQRPVLQLLANDELKALLVQR